MIGGGDQIYNDAVMTQTKLFQQWLNTKNPHHKHEAEFTSEMRDELETFYLERYSMWFSQGLFGMATSQIPMINIWDDHGRRFLLLFNLVGEMAFRIKTSSVTASPNLRDTIRRGG